MYGRGDRGESILWLGYVVVARSLSVGDGLCHEK